MPVKLGTVRGNLIRIVPGTDLDILDAFINARYRGLLNAYPWSRLAADFVLMTVDKYDTGTIAVSADATTLTGTDTVWTTAMTGRRIRIASRPEWYTFTFVSTTSATIDHAYEGTAETAATYRIWDAVYALPSDLDILESLSLPNTDQDFDPTTQEELGKIDAAREEYGRPVTYAPASDDTSNLSQIELWPGPETAEGLNGRYRIEVPDLATSEDTFLPWVDTNIVFYGVLSDLATAAGNQAQAMAWEAKSATLFNSMTREDSYRTPPRQLRMHSRFTDHRADRATGGVSRHWETLHRSEP